MPGRGIGPSRFLRPPVNQGGGGNPPVNVAAPVLSGTPQVGQTVNLSTGTWAGTLPITYLYSFYVNGVLVQQGASQSYLIQPADYGFDIQGTVDAFNGFLPNGFAASNTLTVTVNPAALAHYNRVIADGGVCTYGVLGVDEKWREILQDYSITDILTLNVDSHWLDWFGYKSGSGSGSTTNRAIQKAYSILGANYDYIQNSTTAQPLLGAFDGTNKYLMFPLVTGNHVSTPNVAAIQLTDDFEIELQNMNFKQETVGQVMWSKGADGASTANSLIVGFIGNSTRIYLMLVQGTTVTYYTVPSNVNAASRYFKITRNATTGLIEFFQSTTSTFGAAFHTVTGITGSINAGTTEGRIGDRFGGSNPFGGSIQRVILRKAIGGAISADFDMQQFNRAVSSSTVVSGGLTWTFNLSSGATGLKLMAVDQTMIQGNGTSMGMQAASASLNSEVFTQYSVWRKFSNATAASGILTEYGVGIASGQGAASIPNENVSTESVYTTANIGLNGTSWVATSLLLKVTTFRADINGAPYEQGYLTNNVANTFNAVQSALPNTTAIVATGKNLLARNNAASGWFNGIWVGDLMTTQTDTSGQETAIYNMFATETHII